MTRLETALSQYWKETSVGLLNSSAASEPADYFITINPSEDLEYFSVISIENSSDIPLVLPLCNSSNPIEFKTTDAAIANIINSSTLRKCKIKETTFYGMRGLILNEDLKPLYMTYYTANTHSESRFFIRVDPSVYKCQSCIDKAIARKIIPYFLSTLDKPKVIFEEIKNVHVNKTEELCTEDTIKSIIKENMVSLLYSIYSSND